MSGGLFSHAVVLSFVKNVHTLISWLRTHIEIETLTQCGGIYYLLNTLNLLILKHRHGKYFVLCDGNRNFLCDVNECHDANE
jgi:hypothetical protein